MLGKVAPWEEKRNVTSYKGYGFDPLHARQVARC
jgi:hypothetical protein